MAAGEAAESLGHHPDLHLESFRNVRVDIYTHSVGGITEFDFKLADLIDACPVIYSPKFLREQTTRLALLVGASGAAANEKAAPGAKERPVAEGEVAEAPNKKPR